MSFVPCLTWVKRGVAKAEPEKAEFTKEELERIIKETSENMGNLNMKDIEEMSDSEEGATAPADPDSKKRSAAMAKLDEKIDLTGLEEYGLENYDDDEEEGAAWEGLPGVSYYASNKEDPYITLKNEDDDSDNEDNIIKATDNLLVVGRADKDHSTIEVHIYNEQEGTMYIHHDFILPSFPLSIEWLNFSCGPQKAGNCIAISTMEPTIDIWNLDLVDSLEPLVTLGSKTKTSKSKKKAALNAGHTDAVLDLSWNAISRNVLASASADYTVALWDLTQCRMKTAIRHHTEKVQTLQWHPFEEQSLLSGSFDNTARVFDCRSPDSAHKTWIVNGEVERVAWNHFSPYYFMVSTDQGMVYYYDARADKPVFSLQAHTEAVTGLTFSSQIPGMLMTTSGDKTAKVWDISESKPELVFDKNLNHLGDLQCCSCCPDSPFTFAIGSEKDLKTWNIANITAVKEHFEGRSPVVIKTPDVPAQDIVQSQEDGKTNVGHLNNSANTSQSKTKKKKKKRTGKK